MLDRLKLSHVIAAAVLLLAPLFAIGWTTRKDPAETPLLGIVGGGFIFNYREGEVYYGFTAIVQKPLASGSIIEATFEDPTGEPAHVVRERVTPMTNKYPLRSPPVRGVEAGKGYEVAIRVLDRTGQEELFAATRTYHSQISDDIVPEKPLTVGPGYHPNPEAKENQGG